MTPNTVLETTMAAKLTNIPTTPKTPRRSSSKRGKNVTITTPNQESLINRSKVSPMQVGGLWKPWLILVLYDMWCLKHILGIIIGCSVLT